MVLRDEVTRYIESVLGIELMAKARAKDVLANGVQFHGNEKVTKVALGVSCNEDFLAESIRAGAEYCIFHHGFDSRTHLSRFSIASQKQLRLIINNNLTIAGYHYTLDAQPEFGNNATIAKLLGAKIMGNLYDEWGFVVRLPSPVTLDNLSKKCADIFSHDVLAVKAGDKKVQILGIVSGAGKPYQAQINEMHEQGVELYISGETSESRLHAMQEEGISYFLCGHYATEVFGVQELGKKLKEHYQDKLEVELIDIPNPL